MNTKRLFFGFVMVCTGALSGCGGGGTCIQTADFGCISSSKYTQKLEETLEMNRDIYGDLTDFANQWGLGAINADRAYAHLELAKGATVEPGEGVTVGLIDTGIDTEHVLFADKTISEEFLSGAVDERGEEFSHGTAVASVIGANPENLSPDFREQRGFYGVAWGADLKMFAVPLGDPPPPGTLYSPISLSALGSNDAEDAMLYQHVLGQSMDILNLSFGAYGVIENYAAQDIRSNYGQTIAALAQTAVQDKTILVWAAGNSHGFICSLGTDNCDGSDQLDIDGNPAGALNASSPSILAGMVARIAELQGHSLAVVATDQAGEIAEFSKLRYCRRVVSRGTRCQCVGGLFRPLPG